jgi:hypothetical protein
MLVFLLSLAEYQHMSEAEEITPTLARFQGGIPEDSSGIPRSSAAGSVI